jgi:DNA polymerase I-like protein with 3'-5' exonuclease and polymerase domains
MFIAGDNATRLRAAIDLVEKTYQPIFSLVAELEQQGFSVDATALQAILDSLKAQIPIIKTNVAS